MNFYSALCLVHPPERLGELRGHYTENNTLFARAGTKKLASFNYKIDFNRMYYAPHSDFFSRGKYTTKLYASCSTSARTIK